MSSTVWRLLIVSIVVFLPTIAFILGLVLVWKQMVSTLDIILLVVMYVLTLVGVEGGFHRLITHRAFKTNSIVKGIFIIFGSMASQGPVIFWAASHRKHHGYTDETGDPHSPNLAGSGLINRVKGFFHGHCGWLFAEEVIDWARYTPDLIKDHVIFRLNQLYPLWVVLGLLIPAVVGGVYTQSVAGALSGFLWGGLIRVFLVHHLVWGVNSWCHIFGSQPFQSGDKSKNSLLLALPTLGGAWHNNHHAFPRTADNNFTWWQLDIIGLLIRLLGLLNLVWDINKPTRHMIAAKKGALKNLTQSKSGA